jgi:hypothetical protein
MFNDIVKNLGQYYFNPVDILLADPDTLEFCPNTLQRQPGIHEGASQSELQKRALHRNGLRSVRHPASSAFSL